MTYEHLLNFIRTRMRMSHVYQPVMLLTLLQHRGRSSIRSIAGAILARDESQIEYYEQITKNMVGRVLHNHGIVAGNGSDYSLNDFAALTPGQVTELMIACQDKIAEYVKKRAN